MESFEDAMESFQEEEEEEEYSELSPHHIINIIAEEGEDENGEEEGEGENEGGSIGRGASYIPHLVSIGPNHYGNPKLFAMETQKTKLLDLESRKWNSHTQSSIRNALLEMEGRARKCYSHNFNDVDGDAFVKMMLTDSFFIINLFMGYEHKFCKGFVYSTEITNSEKKEPSSAEEGIEEKLSFQSLYMGELPNSSLFTRRWMLPKICEDLLLLENQLPFFILAKVYVILTDNESTDSLKNLALQFLKQIQFGKVAVMAYDNSIAENPKHLLDLFHSSFVEMDRGECNTSSLKMETKFWVDNASTLRCKGVTFIAREGGRPLDIEFSWLGVLRIPTFCIDDRNISVLKNLLAYEQGSREVKPYFSCLAVFFSNIAATPGDVKFLREAGIIQHQPGNDQMVVLLLRKLYEAVEYSSDDDCLIKCQVERINRYVTYVPGELISYMKRILLANFVHLVVLCVALLFFLSPADTFKLFRIRV